MSNPWLAIDVATAPAQRAREVRRAWERFVSGGWDRSERGEGVGMGFGKDDFEEIMSTHYGQMVVLDDRIVLFANPEDAAEYISFDLQALS